MISIEKKMGFGFLTNSSELFDYSHLKLHYEIKNTNPLEHYIHNILFYIEQS